MHTILAQDHWQISVPLVPKPLFISSSSLLSILHESLVSLHCCILPPQHSCNTIIDSATPMSSVSSLLLFCPGYKITAMRPSACRPSIHRSQSKSEIIVCVDAVIMEKKLWFKFQVQRGRERDGEEKLRKKKYTKQ